MWNLLFYLVKYHGKVKVGVVIVTNAMNLFCVALKIDNEVLLIL